jgi:NADH-quinone oxidoreductase subunit C
MTTAAIPGTDVATRINAAFPDTVIEASEGSVTVKPERLVDIARFLRDDDELDCKYLNCLTGIDWLDHFDVAYVLTSMARNHTLTLETRTSHDDPVVPSLSDVWQGAVLQEREVYDLMGIAFTNHPNLNRIFLWDGFPGHPLRKDFLTLPAGYKPGLQRFPYEFPEGQHNYPSLEPSGSQAAPAVPRLTGLPGMSGLPQTEESSGGQLGALGGGSQGARLRDDSPDGVHGSGSDPMTSGTAAQPEDAAPRPNASDPDAAAGQKEQKE